MKAVLKGMTNDYFDLEEWEPEDPLDFSLDLLLRIGGSNSSGADNFDLVVCTPKWLARYSDAGMWGRGMLVINHYDADLIRSKVVEYIDACSGEDWMSTASRLSRVFLWEFEGYKQ
ncbi:immunity 8 family protein [Stenotrophomonas sp. PS02289]|uniref:immunity 8 family protein n=1 Tax=Stenotrophomonas sp. PS02289 TaxID=2991422 RepID=UPI00249A3635|nr:immunity 8 family protein [Stenotrophomonas sp. PS02289]